MPDPLSSTPHHEPPHRSAALPPRPEPRWPAIVALLAIGGLFYALPDDLTVGPDWMVMVVVAILVAVSSVARRRGKIALAQTTGYFTSGILTLALVGSLVLLVAGLPSHKERPADLLLAASALWICNLVVFASWYWRLDAGGPHQRDLRESHTDGAFLFPQMTLTKDLRKEMGEDQWRPGFVDYLFLAFNTSTAFSPTDVPVLSRWAKLLMMVQSTISLTTLAVLAARAVNIL
jgi:hypothetical protein